MISRSVPLALALLWPALPMTAQTRPPSGSDAAAATALITPKAIGARIATLAHDSMRGRATPSPELEKVAAWIGGEFERFGLEPAGGPHTFLQRYTIERSRWDVSHSSGRFDGAARGRFAMGRDFLVVPVDDPRPGTFEGEIIALASPPSGGDPLAGMDLRGKILVQYSSTTGGRLQLVRHAQWVEAGLAAIVCVTRASDGVWNAWSAQWNQNALQIVSASARVPIIAIRASAAEGLLRSAGLDLPALERAARREPIVRTTTGVRARFILAAHTVQSFEAPNVVGIVRGADPTLRNEYVAFSAHMDHIGVHRPVNGDSIYNGADDDASGTAAVISLAEAFSRLAPAPRRSMIFLTVSGEEQGLWGSQYFAENPPVPMGQIVADINIDMIGRNWPDTIVAIGRQQSNLGRTLERVNATHADLGMTAIDDLWPTERFYYRSDHYNFARNGVPILFFFNGVHEDYHRPSDQVEKIDTEKTARIVKLLFWLGLDVANADERPQWEPNAYREVVGTDHP